MQSEVGELQLDANVWKRVEYRKRARASGAQCFLEPLDPTMPLPPDLEPEHPKDGRPKRQRKELVRLDPEWTFADPEDDDDASDNHDDGYAPPKLRKKRPAASLRKEVRRTIAHEQPARNNTRRARKVDHGSRRLQVPEETPAVMSKPKSAPELSSEMPLKQFKWIEPILKPQQKTHCTDDDSNDDDMYVTIPERQLSTPPTRSPTSSPPYEPGPADVTERLLSSTLVVKNLSARKLYQSLRPIAEAWDKFNKIVTSSGGAMGKS